jgi:hypothetical protein
MSNVSGIYTVNVGENQKNITLTANKEYCVDFDNLNAGEYSISVSYSQSDNYASAFKKGGIINVFKANSSVEIVDVCDGVFNTTPALITVNFSNCTNVTYVLHKGNNQNKEDK